MIAKKNPGVDLERKRIVLFNVGLLTAGAFTLAAFSYSEPLIIIDEERAALAANIQYHLEAEETPKDEPVVKDQLVDEEQSQSLQMGNENSVSENSTSSSNNTNQVQAGIGTSGLNGIVIPGTKNRVVPTGGIVEFPPIVASYVGGRPAMLQHMGDVQEYPEIDQILGNQGTVYVSFVVETDGSISNVKIPRELSPTLDREAKRIVRSFPKWNPGEDKYGPVRTRVQLPITFILEG